MSPPPTSGHSSVWRYRSHSGDPAFAESADFLEACQGVQRLLLRVAFNEVAGHCVQADVQGEKVGETTMVAVEHSALGFMPATRVTVRCLGWGSLAFAREVGFKGVEPLAVHVHAKRRTIATWWPRPASVRQASVGHRIALRKLAAEREQQFALSFRLHAFCEDRAACPAASMNDHVGKPAGVAQIYASGTQWVLPVDVAESVVASSSASNTAGSSGAPNR